MKPLFLLDNLVIHSTVLYQDTVLTLVGPKTSNRAPGLREREMENRS